VVSLQTLLTKGQQWDWWNSMLIRGLVISAIISFILLLIIEIGKEERIMNFRVFHNLSFAMGTFMSIVAYMILFASVAIIPTWLQMGMDYTPFWAGLATLPSLFTAIISTIALPKLMKVMRKSVITAICFAIFVITYFWMMRFTTAVDLPTIVMVRLLYGVGIVYNTTLIALSFSDITRDEMASASGIYFFLRTFSGAIGTSLFATIWQRRTIFHHFRITENVNWFRYPVEQINQLFLNLGLYGKEKWTILNQEVNNQAMMLAMIDIMALAAIGCLILIPMVLILGQVRVRACKKKLKQKTG
jgi:DHA2 family multidrug resistance protein